MSKVFRIHIRRSAGASVLVFVAALSLGMWTLFGDPVSSSAAPGASTSVDLGQVAAKLEVLHQRTLLPARPSGVNPESSRPSLSTYCLGLVLGNCATKPVPEIRS